MHVGYGASIEDNLVVCESVFDEKETLECLAKHYIDRKAARVVLKNKYGLQTDVTAPAMHRAMRKSKYNQKNEQNNNNINNNNIITNNALVVFPPELSISGLQNLNLFSSILSLNDENSTYHISTDNIVVDDDDDDMHIGLPAGIEFDSQYGVFHGTPTDCGVFFMQVTAVNNV
eukprot:Pgem_evm1s5519